MDVVAIRDSADGSLSHTAALNSPEVIVPVDPTK